MENQISNQDCGCSNGCCTPKTKSSLWKRLFFFVIILAAGTIITVKLVAKQSEPTAKCCNTEASKSCCPHAVTSKEPACGAKHAAAQTKKQ